MIKHHPKFELLQSFVNGELPASLSAAIAMHADMCPKCQSHIAALTEQIAEASFETESLDGEIYSESIDNSLNFDDMLSEITQSTAVFEAVAHQENQITFNSTSYTLPTTLNNMSFGKASNIGKLSRTRVQLDENEIHTSLLHIEPGGGVPQHTHKGFELTLLLEGSFHDEHGDYVKGDFIMLEGEHQHNPVSEKGCLCFTVANAPLHFTQGINKLLNPISAFIY